MSEYGRQCKEVKEKESREWRKDARRHRWDTFIPAPKENRGQIDDNCLAFSAASIIWLLVSLDYTVDFTITSLWTRLEKPMQSFRQPVSRLDFFFQLISISRFPYSLPKVIFFVAIRICLLKSVTHKTRHPIGLATSYSQCHAASQSESGENSHLARTYIHTVLCSWAHIKVRFGPLSWLYLSCNLAM